MTSNYSPTASGWAIVLLSAAVLALGGCGRKGGLDLPPTASPQAAAAAQADADHDHGPAESSKSLFNPYSSTNAPPAAAKGTKQPFILDPLLDSK